MSELREGSQQFLETIEQPLVGLTPEILSLSASENEPRNSDISDYNEGESEVTPARGRIGKALNIGKRALESTLLFISVGPPNELFRYGTLAYATAKTGDPLLAASAFAASNVAMETMATFVTADLADSKGVVRGIERTNKILERLKINPKAKLNWGVKSGIYYLGGSGVAILVEQREDQTRTTEQNIKFGLKTTAILSAVCGVQGYLIADGIADPSPYTISGAAIAVGSIIGGASVLKRAFSRKNNEVVGDNIPAVGSDLMAMGRSDDFSLDVIDTGNAA